MFLNYPVGVALPQEKPSITYQVSTQPNVLLELVEELKTKRIGFPKTVIFCRRYQDCTQLYLVMKYEMCEFFTEPPSTTDIHDNHLVMMYHSAATQATKEKAIASFYHPDGKLRRLIATTAFGLGIDCPDISQIIHWGPPAELDSYVQETGRGGRDGRRCRALLLCGKLAQHTGNDMRV